MTIYSLDVLLFLLGTSSTVASWPAYRFLKRQVRSSGIPNSFRIFQFIVIYTAKGFGVVNKAGIDVFLEFSCFFDPFCASSPFLSSTISLLEPLNSYVWVWISYTWRHSTRSHFCTASFSKTLRCIQAAVCVGSSFLSVLIAVLLDGCATICVSISLLRSTWVVFSFWLLWLKLLWLFLYKSVFI